MRKKQELERDRANRLLNYGPVSLITSKFKEQKNISTVSWTMPVSSNPALVAIAVTKKRFTYSLIKESREFIINIPTADLKKEVLFCGKTTGREMDKFEKSGLTPVAAKKVDAPIVDECFAHLECKVVDEISSGDHMLFIGDVIAVYSEEGSFGEDGVINLDKVNPLLHLGADHFGTVNKLD
ncbi:flavin reductase family protein [Candidatus Margulisiibacteriota bacterium]